MCVRVVVCDSHTQSLDKQEMEMVCGCFALLDHSVFQMFFQHLFVGICNCVNGVFVVPSASFWDCLGLHVVVLESVCRV